MTIAFERHAPILPVRCVAAALAHYRKLGFAAVGYEERIDGDPIYGFLRRDGIELHLVRTPDLDRRCSTSACYVYVNDADALYEEWRCAGVVRLHEPTNRDYRLREFAHIDPDGNLLRIGSPLRSTQPTD
jgi:hypothetical protein